MKRELVLIIIAILLLTSCNRALCPAYSDSANNMKNSFLQKGSVRADGINRIYRDNPQKKLRKPGKSIRLRKGNGKILGDLMRVNNLVRREMSAV